MNNIDGSTMRLLEFLVREAPKARLGQAYKYVEDHQEMVDLINIRDYIIMVFLDELGIDDNGNLKLDEELKNKDDKFWIAMQQAITIHGGFACSPFVDISKWMKNIEDKYSKKKDVDLYKNNIISQLKKDN